MARITPIDEARSETTSAGSQLVKDEVRPLAEKVKKLADGLVKKVQDATDKLIKDNDHAVADSQRLFIAVAAVSIILALLLGYLLSWSIVGPIRHMQTRLAAIASGDFSGHVEVSNRDELGALASNLNRMNDELGRMYEAVETAEPAQVGVPGHHVARARTPLNAIIGFSQVLKEQMYGELNATQAEYVDDVLSSGQHLLNLINDILDLAKVEAGRMELQPTTFALPALLDNSMSLVRERAIRQGVSLTDGDRSVGPRADERKVKQILFNLLSNAVKFTPGGGRVTWRRASPTTGTSRSRSEIPGSASAPRIRPGSSRSSTRWTGVTQEGTGLGLALTRRLVELHHGRLERCAASLASGSTFTVWLPLRQAGAAAGIAL